jgi:hypothetical protein
VASVISAQTVAWFSVLFHMISMPNAANSRALSAGGSRGRMSPGAEDAGGEEQAGGQVTGVGPGLAGN